jgi:hypothetical protein
VSRGICEVGGTPGVQLALPASPAPADPPTPGALPPAPAAGGTDEPPAFAPNDDPPVASPPLPPLGPVPPFVPSTPQPATIVIADRIFQVFMPLTSLRYVIAITRWARA